jgi:formylglycine-generating enzyme required for sulfatase activity
MISQRRSVSWRWIVATCIVWALASSQKFGSAQERAAVPSVARQKEIAKDLEDAYNLSRLESVSKKSDAVKKLLEASRDAAMPDEERYVVLTTVISLARDIGDSVNWLDAVDRLVRTFAVDPHKEKSQLLTDFLKISKSGNQLKLLVEEAISTSQLLAHENRYVEASALLNAATAAVQRASGADSLKKLVAKASDDVAAREKDWKAFQAATKKLETNADDPLANFTFGRWHVLQEADWKTALPFLAKGIDLKWKAAADLEMTGGTDALVQVAIGDAWFEIGENESGAAKSALLLHAGNWYEEAQPKLTSVLKKQALAKRLEKIAPLKVSTSPAKSVAPTETTNPARKAWHGWPVTAPPPAIAPFDIEQAKKHQQAWGAYLKIPVEFTNSIGMKFNLIPPGAFMMGSTPAEIDAALVQAGSDDYWKSFIRREAPRHNVVLTQPIYVGVHEVTQSQYEKVMGKNPSHFSQKGAGNGSVAGVDTGNHPVEMVSWNDAAEFCSRLSQQEKLKPFYVGEGATITFVNGTGYRLLTEAEWEFACRAGTTTRLWIGDNDEDLLLGGWFGTNSGGRTHTVGKLRANPFGLFDMHGNLWEWVHDGWEPTYYNGFSETPAINPLGPSAARSEIVIRGGGWPDSTTFCRSSSRYAYDPIPRRHYIGFRVSLVAVGTRARRP